MDRKVEAPASVAAESEGQVVQVQAPSECHRPQSSSTARLMARRTSPKPSRAHVYLYDVEFDGELIVTASADPECDLARALLMRGVTGTIALIDGKTGEHRVTVNIEKAAKLTVRDTAREGPRFVRWKPFDPGDGPHRSDERGEVMTRHTPSILAALVRDEGSARKAYKFTPGAYTYAALIAIRRALQLMGGKADGAE